MAIWIIEKPKDVEIEFNNEGVTTYEVFPFTRFIKALLNSSEWSANWKAVQNAIEIDEVCDTEEDFFELSDHPYTMLKKVAENPANGYSIHPLILRNIPSYFSAIFDAKKKGTAE